MNMNIQNLLNQFIGPGDTTSSAGNTAQGIGDTLNRLGDKLPGGLAGGAAAGGIMALLMGNKSARKIAGKAAGYGGAALLGGLAYKAYSNWQHNKGGQTTTWSDTGNTMLQTNDASTPGDAQAPDFQLQLIKAMIAAAKADGHIDATEQQRIFSAVEEMDASNEVKGVIFDLLQQPITLGELAAGAANIEQRSELYLASCLVINPDQPSEKAHLEQLAAVLELPEGLAQQLQWQAQRAMADAA
jgi:uncharacterized membrane protein YebE (DUF533 family)